MQHGCILLHPDAQNPFPGLPCRCVVLRPSPQRPSAPSSRAASQTSPCSRSGKPEAAAGLCWGLSGPVRDQTKPFPAAEECGTHCLDGRGADEVSWDATQRVQSVGAWQLNSAALARWRHRQRPIAPRDWVEIRCLLPTGGHAGHWRSSSCAAQISSASRGESKQTSSSSASSMIVSKVLSPPQLTISSPKFSDQIGSSGSHNGPSPDGDSEMTKSRYGKDARDAIGDLVQPWKTRRAQSKGGPPQPCRGGMTSFRIGTWRRAAVEDSRNGTQV